jgi:hypothetical protein
MCQHHLILILSPSSSRSRMKEKTDKVRAIFDIENIDFANNQI